MTVEHHWKSTQNIAGEIHSHAHSLTLSVYTLLNATRGQALNLISVCGNSAVEELYLYGCLTVLSINDIFILNVLSVSQVGM